MEKLLDALKTRQRIKKLTDAEFAEGLGVSRSTWSLVRAGQVKFNIPILRGILVAYPDMQSHVLKYIMSS